MRTATRLALATLIAVVGSACGLEGSAGGGGTDLAGRTTTITFSIAVSDDEKPAVQELISRFENRSRTDTGLDLLTRFRNPPRTRVNLVT